MPSSGFEMERKLLCEDSLWRGHWWLARRLAVVVVVVCSPGDVRRSLCGHAMVGLVPGPGYVTRSSPGAGGPADHIPPPTHRQPGHSNTPPVLPLVITQTARPISIPALEQSAGGVMQLHATGGPRPALAQWTVQSVECHLYLSSQ